MQEPARALLLTWHLLQTHQQAGELDSETTVEAGKSSLSLIMLLWRTAFWALGVNSQALFYAYSNTLVKLLLQHEGSLTLLCTFIYLPDFLTTLSAALLHLLTVICGLWAAVAYSKKP